MNSRYFRDLVLSRTLLELEEVYVSLHTADPGDTGGNEVAAQRQLVELGRSAPGTASNQNVLEYNDLPSVVVTHFGIWDAERGGNYLTGGGLVEPQAVRPGMALRWRETELILRIG